MAKRKLLWALPVVALAGVGGMWMMTGEEASPAKEVVDAGDLSDDLTFIDESNRADALVQAQRKVIESEYVDEEGNVQRMDVSEDLKLKTMMENYPIPVTEPGKPEPRMEGLVLKLVSRQDGGTNVLEKSSMKVVDTKTFEAWEQLFADWRQEKIDKKAFLKKWKQKEPSESGLTAPTVFVHEFPYSQLAQEMMDNILKKIEEEGGSTAPHIVFVSVEFNQETGRYTLYYAGSHIE